MDTRILGGSLKVSAVVLGRMTMTGGDGGDPDRDHVVIEIQGGRYSDVLEAATNL